MQHVAQITVRHFVIPGVELARESIMPDSETIQDFLTRTNWQFKLPTICVVNGQPVLRDRWSTLTISKDDSLIFLSRPFGGGGGSKLKSVFGIVALIALTAIAPWAAAGLGASFGLGAAGISLLQAGIVIGGGLLIATLIAPKPGGQPNTATADQGSVDQVYSLTVGGNTGKLLSPIPVSYGRLKTFPDYAFYPWSEYIGQDQYLNIPLCLGLGKYRLEQILIDDTVMWDYITGFEANFADVQIAYYNPGENVTLFPINVIQAPEVSGQDIPDPNITPWIGGFIANNAGTTAYSVAVDLGFPSGLYSVNAESGVIGSASVTVIIQYRLVDDAGAPLNAYSTWYTNTFTMSTRNPQRFTINQAVSPGRYEFRIARTDAPAATSNTVNNIAWLGLRAYIVGPTSFPYTSTVAIRIKATSQLTQTSARRFSVITTRILPVWDGSAFVEQPTRSPFWAFWDAATNSVYGANRSPAKVDFATIVSEDAKAVTRGDTFNYCFTSAEAVPQAFDTILKVARCKHRWTGDILSLVRDEYKPVPQMLLTDRQIIRGSLNFDYIFNDDEQSDCVILEYLDENIWNPAEIQYPPNALDFTGVKPARIRLNGITDRNHGIRETAFFYRQAYYRRIRVNADTEYDGRILNYGSVIRLQSDLPQSWGTTGIITDNVDGALFMSPAPTWGTGQHYINVRTRTGGSFGPIRVGHGASDAIAVLNSTDLADVEAQLGMTLAEALAREDGAEDPAFDFGEGTNVSRRCIILSGRPQNDRVSLQMVADDENVHLTDLEVVPDIPSGPILTNPKVPIVAGLSANFRQGVAEPIVDATWWPAAGAIYYVAFASYDGGTTRTPVYEGVEPVCSFVASRANIRLYVAGVGSSHGPFSTYDLNVPDIEIGKNTVSPASMKEGLRDYVMNYLKQVEAQVTSFRQIVAAAASEQDAANALNKVSQSTALSLQSIEFTAGISQVQSIVDGIDADVVSLQTALTLETDTRAAAITETLSLISTIDNKLLAAWTVVLDVNGYISGIEAYNDGETSAFIIRTDTFQVVSPGDTGGAPIPVFTISNVSGVPKIVFRGDMIGDGTITATKLSVSQLSAITANFGDAIFSGVARAQSNKLVIDFSGNRIVVSD